MIVRVIIEVEVFDPAKLMEYAESKWEEWNRGDDVTLPEAVYESLVLNAPESGSYGVGCEILRSETKIIDE